MLQRFIIIVFLLLLASPCFGESEEKAETKTPKAPIIIATGEKGLGLVQYSEAETAYLATLPNGAILLPVFTTAEDELIVARKTSLTDSNVKDVLAEKFVDEENPSALELSLPELQSLSFDNTSTTFAHSTTLARHLDIITAIQARDTGPSKLVFELRKPWLHKIHEKDIGALLVEELKNYSFSPGTEIYIASYNPDVLEQIHQVTQNSQNAISLLFLFGENGGEEAKQNNFGSWESYDYEWLYTTTGLRFIASFAQSFSFNSKVFSNESESQKYTDLLRRSKDFDLDFWLLENSSETNVLTNDRLNIDLIDGVITSEPENYIQSKQEEVTEQETQKTPPINQLLSELNISTT